MFNTQILNYFFFKIFILAGITKDLNMLVAKSSRKFSFADGMEAELASEPPPEMFDKMEGTVLHVAFMEYPVMVV